MGPTSLLVAALCWYPARWAYRRGARLPAASGAAAGKVVRRPKGCPNLRGSFGRSPSSVGLPPNGSSPTCGHWRRRGKRPSHWVPPPRGCTATPRVVYGRRRLTGVGGAVAAGSPRIVGFPPPAVFPLGGARHRLLVCRRSWAPLGNGRVATGAGHPFVSARRSGGAPSWRASRHPGRCPAARSVDLTGQIATVTRMPTARRQLRLVAAPPERVT